MESFPFSEELRNLNLSVEDILMLQNYVLLTDRQKGKVDGFINSLITEKIKTKNIIT